jgi:MFS family permease
MRRARGLVPSLPRAAWAVLAGDAVSALGSGLTLPFFVVYLHEARGLGLGLAGLALASMAGAGLAGNLLGGWLSDHAGPRTALAVGLLAAAAGSLAVALVFAPWHAFAAATLLGIGAGLCLPALDALLAAVVGPERRADAFGVRHATLNAGFGLGALLAAVLVTGAGPSRLALLYVLDAASFLVFVPLLFTLSALGRRVPGGGEVAVSRAGYREIVRDRVFRRLWGLMALLVTAGYAQYHAAFPVYATSAGGIGAEGLSLAFAANTLTVVAVQLLAIRLLAGRRRTLGVALTGALFAAAWAITLLAGQLAGAPATALFALAMAVLALGETALAPTMPALVNDLAPAPLRGRYNGAFALASSSGFIAGPLVAGSALAAGFDDALLATLIAACALAALAATRLGRTLPPALNVAGATP